MGTICVPYVSRARPSVPPQGPQTSILAFSQKGTGATENSRQKNPKMGMMP